MFKELFVIYNVTALFLFLFTFYCHFVSNLKIRFVILAFWRNWIYFEHLNITYYIYINFPNFSVLRAHMITICVISFILSNIWTIIIIFYFTYPLRHLPRCEVINIHILYYSITVSNLKWWSLIIMLNWIWIAANTHFFKNFKKIWI